MIRRGVNWRRRKRLWKKTHAWTRRNGSSKSMRTMRVVGGIRHPRWRQT